MIKKIEQLVYRVAARRRSRKLSYWPYTFDEGCDPRSGFPEIAKDYLRGRSLKGAIKAYESAVSCTTHCLENLSPRSAKFQRCSGPQESDEVIQRWIDTYYGNMAARYKMRLERLRRVKAGEYKGLKGGIN